MRQASSKLPPERVVSAAAVAGRGIAASGTESIGVAGGSRADPLSHRSKGFQKGWLDRLRVGSVSELLLRFFLCKVLYSCYYLPLPPREAAKRVNWLSLAVSVLRPWLAIAKAPELGAVVCGAELGGPFLFWYERHSAGFSHGFPSQSFPSRTPTRRDNLIAEMQRLIERGSQ